MLELAPYTNDAPRMLSATLLEDPVIRARPVGETTGSSFVAFLDGKQRSETVGYLGGLSVLAGLPAAVVRERCDKRMCTWQSPLFGWRMYAPRVLLGDEHWETLAAELGESLVDTSEDVRTGGAHPFALRDATIKRVNAHRDALEQELAERWCSVGNGTLFLDGGIRGSRIVAESSRVVGVIKSHNTLYVEGAAFATVIGLVCGERSSAFLMESKNRPTVASWYLRMRDPTDRDPLWGLVRVEVSHHAGSAISDRADEVSRWILAEASPLALPDGRWDKMVYGIRDCEEYLRAVST